MIDLVKKRFKKEILGTLVRSSGPCIYTLVNVYVDLVVFTRIAGTL